MRNGGFQALSERCLTWILRLAKAGFTAPD